MADSSPVKPKKLPFWGTLGAAYGAFFSNLGTILGLAGRWLIVLIPMYAAYTWFLYPQLFALYEAVHTGAPPPTDTSMTIIGVVFWLAILIPLSAIAVGWHRYLLRHEAPVQSSGFGFDHVTKSYAIAALIIGVIGHVPTVLQQLTAGGTSDLYKALQVIAIIGVYVALAITARLSIALPAIAVEGPGAKLSEAWAATRGNTIRLFFGLMLSVLPMIASSFLSFFLLGVIPDRMVYSIAASLTGIVSLLLLTIGVGYWSFAWRHFHNVTWQS